METHNDRLPPGFVQKYLNRGRMAHIFGTRIDKLTREELLAVIGFLGEEGTPVASVLARDLARLQERSR